MLVVEGGVVDVPALVVETVVLAVELLVVLGIVLAVVLGVVEAVLELGSVVVVDATLVEDAVLVEAVLVATVVVEDVDLCCTNPKNQDMERYRSPGRVKLQNRLRTQHRRFQ